MIAPTSESSTSTKQELIKITRDMLDAWEKGAWGENSDRNFADFAKWLSEQSSKILLTSA